MKPALLVYFCYFWKDKSLLILSLFISEYLDQIPPYREMKEGLSVKLQNENMFLLKIKIKQNPGCPNKGYNAILKHIPQNIRAYTRSKKTELINDWENIAYWEKSEKSKALTKKFGLFQIQWQSETMWQSETAGQSETIYLLQNISLGHEPLSSRDPVSILYVRYARTFMMVDIKLRNANLQ